MSIDITSGTGSPAIMYGLFDINGATVGETIQTLSSDFQDTGDDYGFNFIVPVTANFVTNGGKIWLRCNTGTLTFNNTITITRLSAGDL